MTDEEQKRMDRHEAKEASKSMLIRDKEGRVTFRGEWIPVTEETMTEFEKDLRDAPDEDNDPIIATGKDYKPMEK